MSEVNSSGVIQLMDAQISEKGLKAVAFRLTSARRARGGWLSLIGMLDWESLQGGVTFGHHDTKTYPSNVLVHLSYSVEEPQKTSGRSPHRLATV